MASYKDIDKILKENGKITDLGYSKGKIRNLLLDLLEYKIDNFKYNERTDYNYLLRVFEYFPYYFEYGFNNKKEFYLRIKNIRDKVKTLLVQKPGSISKSSTNFQFLKNLIDNLETVSLSLLYDYIDKYDGSKYEFINFLVFEVKRLSLFEDALKRFPYIANFETKECDSLIDEVIRKYIEELEIYTKNKELGALDEVIYYDEVLKLLLNCDKLNFNIIKQNYWLNYINKLIDDVSYSKFNNLTKQKYVFFLNDLCNSIKGIKNDNIEYLKYKYDIKSSFNPSFNLECQRILNNNDFKKRKIIKDDVILTFDGNDAKEIDDALSIKKLDNGNYLLGVHIADPLFFMNNNSIIYDEAKRRTTSIYLSDLTVPMFPSELSSNAASLLENEMRPATSYYYEISLNGEIVDYKFYKSYIQIYKNMTYGDFNKIISCGFVDEKIYQTIVDLTNIYPVLSKIYKIDPYYEKINRSSMNITDTNITGNTISEKLVESAMVLNNHMVAKYFASNDLPFIYRIHAMDDDTMKRILDFSNSIRLDDSNSEYLKYINMIKNIYPQASYSITNKGHFGLGLDFYSHITSPLRRFADIIASECLNKMYFNEFNDKDVYRIEDNLQETIKTINQKRLSIEVFSINYEKNKHNK